MKFQIMWKNEVIADIETYPNTEEVKIKRSSSYPFFLNNTVNRRRIYEFIKSRCVEENRADIKEILNAMNLDEYNPWKMIRITHGVDWDDFYWIRFEGEKIKWEDVRVRK